MTLEKLGKQGEFFSSTLWRYLLWCNAVMNAQYAAVCVVKLMYDRDGRCIARDR